MLNNAFLIILLIVFFSSGLFGAGNKYKKTDSKNDIIKKRKQIENTLTLLKNDRGLVPFYRLDTLKIAALSIGSENHNVFHETLKLYANISCFSVTETTDDYLKKYLDSLGNFNLVFISLHKKNDSSDVDLDLSPNTIGFINSLAEKKSVVLDVFGSPLLLLNSVDLDKIESILVSYVNDSISQELSAQLLFGGIPAKGKLPVTISSKYKAGSGITLNLQMRFKYVLPEEIGANPVILAQVDSLVQNAIKEHAFPGCQVFAAKDGKVFYNKSFGFHTYDSSKTVSIFDLYDIASITKVAATTASLMKLYDEGKFDPMTKVSKYIPSLDSTDKKDITSKDILTHYARLSPYLLFWARTVSKNDHQWKPGIYSKTFSEKFPYQVADSMFIVKEYPDSMYMQIAKSKLLPKKKYKYSDNGMYLLKKVIEKISTQSLDVFAESTFYSMLGSYTMCYNPLLKFSKSQIIPTENDTSFRKQLIHGFVHDPGAAMLGGVAGHAGLFSNANDLAKLFQMFLNKGVYGGNQYLKKETINFFNTSPYVKKGNRRAYGFDKPEPNRKKESPVNKCVSMKAFGHQGFTGTVVWADPENGILFVFLSNRVYPDAENKMIGKLGVRTKVQCLIYDSLK